MFINMLNPSAPNTTRIIQFKYTTDDEGDMKISINTKGFEDDPEAVAAYLSATITCLSDPNIFEN